MSGQDDSTPQEPAKSTPVPRRGAYLDQLQRLGESGLFSPAQWRRRILFWSGAVLVGLAAVGMASAADALFGVFKHVVARPDFRDASTQAPLAAVLSC